MLLNQANHQQRSCGNESKNSTTVPRPLVSRSILGSSSGETFLNKSRSAKCWGHSLRTYSTVSSWPHSQLWPHSSMPFFRRYFFRTPWLVRSCNNLLKVWWDRLFMKDFSGLGYFLPYNFLLTVEYSGWFHLVYYNMIPIHRARQHAKCSLAFARPCAMSFCDRTLAAFIVDTCSNICHYQCHSFSQLYTNTVINDLI